MQDAKAGARDFGVFVNATVNRMWWARAATLEALKQWAFGCGWTVGPGRRGASPHETRTAAGMVWD